MADRNVYQITPFMHVADIEAAVRFFVEVLGFDLEFRHSNYAYVALEGAGLRILESRDPDELGTPHRGFGYYVDVSDLDAVIRKVGPSLSKLPPEDVHGPVDQPYRQRELMIRAPDGNLIVFGQAID